MGVNKKSVREKSIDFYIKFQNLLEEYNAEIRTDENGNINVFADNNMVVTKRGKMNNDNIVFCTSNPVNRFAPVRRTALDGKTWWTVYDYERGDYSTYTMHGIYKTKADCQWAIDNSLDLISNY